MNRAEASRSEVAQDWVMMVNDDIADSYTLVTAAAFHEVYEEHGWKQADFSEENEKQVLEPQDETAPPEEADQASA